MCWMNVDNIFATIDAAQKAAFYFASNKTYKVVLPKELPQATTIRMFAFLH